MFLIIDLFKEIDAIIWVAIIILFFLVLLLFSVLFEIRDNLKEINNKIVDNQK